MSNKTALIFVRAVYSLCLIGSGGTLASSVAANEQWPYGTSRPDWQSEPTYHHGYYDGDRSPFYGRPHQRAPRGIGTGSGGRRGDSRRALVKGLPREAWIFNGRYLPPGPERERVVKAYHQSLMAARAQRIRTKHRTTAERMPAAQPKPAAQRKAAATRKPVAKPQVIAGRGLASTKKPAAQRKAAATRKPVTKPQVIAGRGLASPKQLATSNALTAPSAGRSPDPEPKSSADTGSFAEDMPAWLYWGLLSLLLICLLRVCWPALRWYGRHWVDHRVRVLNDYDAIRRRDLENHAEAVATLGEGGVFTFAVKGQRFPDGYTRPVLEWNHPSDPNLQLFVYRSEQSDAAISAEQLKHDERFVCVSMPAPGAGREIDQTARNGRTYYYYAMYEYIVERMEPKIYNLFGRQISKTGFLLFALLPALYSVKAVLSSQKVASRRILRSPPIEVPYEMELLEQKAFTGGADAGVLHANGRLIPVERESGDVVDLPALREPAEQAHPMPEIFERFTQIGQNKVTGDEIRKLTKSRSVIGYRKESGQKNVISVPLLK